MPRRLAVIAAISVAVVLTVDAWTYEDTGEWGGLCASGQHQSPVDFEAASAKPSTDLAPLTLQGSCDFRDYDVTTMNNGHTTMLSFTPRNLAVPRCFLVDPTRVPQVPGIFHHFLQAHLHFPPEHRVPNAESVMEVHLVFADDVNPASKVVVGVQLREGQSSGCGIRALLNGPSPWPINESHRVAAPCSLKSLLPHKRSYFTYSGSLTTPPCDEGVRWIVMQSDIVVAADDVARFERILRADWAQELSVPEKRVKNALNARPVQALNGREVLIFETDAVEESETAAPPSWISENGALLVMVGGFAIIGVFAQLTMNKYSTDDQPDGEEGRPSELTMSTSVAIPSYGAVDNEPRHK